MRFMTRFIALLKSSFFVNKQKGYTDMVMKRESDGEHPASHYLVVEDKNVVSTWHLRVRDVNGKVDPGLVGAAWAACHGGFRGNKYEGPMKQAAIKKLRKLYEQMGKTPPMSKTLFYKDAAGQSWFIGIYSNNFEDRQKEILSWDSHLDYAKWLKKTGVKPPIIAMHLPQYGGGLHLARLLELGMGGITAEKFNQESLKLYAATAVAQTELVVPVNGFVLVFGKILPNKESVVETIKSSNVTWGMSHGFIPVEESDNIINKYRAFEFTYLPQSIAANEFTTIDIKDKQAMVDQLKNLTDEERETISQIIDLEKLEEGTASAKEILSRIFASKEMHDDMHEDEDTEKDEKEEEKDKALIEVEDKSYEQIRERLFADLNVAELEATFKNFAEVFKALSARIHTLEAQLKEVEREEDEKIADQFKQIPWGAFFKEAETEDDPKLIEALKNKDGQLVNTDEFNMLTDGFWKPFTTSA